MGSIVKKIKKTVKKIVKKNPITKIFKKAAKGIKRLGSKLWDGIKKVGGKALRAWGKISQKLGPIGTVALSFAMPYLLGPLSGMAGTAWSNMATWMGTPATGAGSTFINVFKTLGNSAMQGAQFVGSTFKGITQTLSQTVKGFAGEGGSLSKGFEALWGGTKDVFSGRAGMGTLKGTQSVIGTAAEGLGQTVTSYGGDLVSKASGFVKTGGVNMMNANVANAQAYKAISNAMASVTSQYTPEMAKYARTLQNQYQLDAYTAHQHAMSNGGIINVDPANGMSSYNLDFSSSRDFKFNRAGPNVAPNVGEYSYTGNASKLKFGDTNSYIKLQGGQYSVEGDTFGYGDTAKKDSLMSKASSAASKFLDNYGEGEEELTAYPGGYDASLDPYNTYYDGTNVASAGGGGLLTKEQQQFFMNQNLNIGRG